MKYDEIPDIQCKCMQISCMQMCLSFGLVCFFLALTSLDSFMNEALHSNW